MMTNVIAMIDAEIAKLQEARKLLSGTTDVLAKIGTGRGRPKGSKNTPKIEEPQAKRTMSDEGRAKIGAAQRKRHATKKKAAKKAAKEVAQLEAPAE